MFQFQLLPVQDASLITYPQFLDERGSFMKVFHSEILKANNIHFELKESYFSFSKKDVIRGMHFQNPPYHHSKIVFCPHGAILDVMLDLRKSSPTFGQYYSAVLSQENHQAFYIPEGFAHGFKALTDDALTYYLVSSEYNKDNDKGIHFDSFGMDWEVQEPLLSSRDLSFPKFQDWDSVF